MKKLKPNIRKKFDFKVGLIGCGNIAHTQLNYISNYIHRENIAICDSDKIRMTALSKRFRVSKLYQNCNQLLENFSPDIVHILTPPHTHVNLAVACLRNGSNLFIEKPMCITPEEAETISRVASENSRYVCIDHLLPFDPLVDRAKKLVDSRKFGELIKISITDFRNYYERKKSGVSAAWLLHLPGELLFDIMPHHLSILNHFLPDLEFTGTKYRRTGPDLTEILCAFTSPSHAAEFRIDINNSEPIFTVKLICQKGTITVDFRNRSLAIKKKYSNDIFCKKRSQAHSLVKRASTEIIQSILKIRFSQDSYIGMSHLIGKFYAAIQDKNSSPVSHHNGLRVMKQLDQIFKAVGATASTNKINLSGSHSNRIPENKKNGPDILVTGASGFIGRQLVNRLVDSGCYIRVLTRSRIYKSSFINRFSDNVEVYCGDIADSSFVEEIFSGVNTVYHLAAATTGGWQQHIDSTVKGTQNIMQSALSRNCKKVVYVSTIALLNQTKYPANKVIDEDFPYEEYPEKRDPYCFSKLWAEKIVRHYATQSKNQNVIILRPGIVYGYEKTPTGNLARKLGKFLILRGGQGRLLPLVYIDNLIDAIILAGQSEKSGIYNVIDDENITLGEFINHYRGLTHADFRAVYLTIPTLLAFHKIVAAVRKILSRPDNYLNYRLKCLRKSVKHSSRRIKTDLGWSQKVKFEDGLNLALHDTHNLNQ